MTTHTFPTRVNVDSDQPPSASPFEVGNSEANLGATYAAGTNLPAAIAFSYAAIQSVYMLSDVDMTIKTNSSSSPAQTITLKAGRPLVWRVGDGYFANPFTANVTQFFLTLASAGRLRVKILLA